MIRPILRWPDKHLRTRAAPVGAVDDEVRALWQDMIETMDAMPGVGLAAPQIGVLRRVAVVDASDARGQAIRLADPEVVAVAEQRKRGPEGSPCLPGITAEIERPVWVDASFLDHHGMRVRQRFEGLWGISLLHQIDHLNGRMYFDNLSRVKRDMLLRRAAKAG